MIPLKLSDSVLEREKKIKDILSRGKIVRFTMDEVIKDVNEWNIDADKDLIAFRIENAASSFVCWWSDDYEISEIENWYERQPFDYQQLPRNGDERGV